MVMTSPGEFSLLPPFGITISSFPKMIVTDSDPDRLTQRPPKVQKEQKQGRKKFVLMCH